MRNFLNLGCGVGSVIDSRSLVSWLNILLCKGAALFLAASTLKFHSHYAELICALGCHQGRLFVAREQICRVTISRDAARSTLFRLRSNHRTVSRWCSNWLVRQPSRHRPCRL